MVTNTETSEGCFFKNFKPIFPPGAIFSLKTRELNISILTFLVPSFPSSLQRQDLPVEKPALDN